MIKEEFSTFVMAGISEHTDVSVDELSAPGFSLSNLIAASEKLINSVDLMEVFARVSMAIKKEYQVTPKLPALPLDTPLSEVIDRLFETVEAKVEVVA